MCLSRRDEKRIRLVWKLMLQGFSARAADRIARKAYPPEIKQAPPRDVYPHP